MSLRNSVPIARMLVLSAFLLFGTSLYADQEISGYQTLNQEPKGTGMDLVLLQSEMFRLPFEIKYPQSWYVREEYGGVPSLFVSREPIRTMAEQYQVGMTIYYHINFFVPQKEDPNSPLGQMAESVIKIRTWESTKEDFAKPTLEKGRRVILQEEITFNGQPALRLEWESSEVHVLSYCVKAGNHLMLLTLEAPLDEFEAFRPIFQEIIDSAKFTR